MKKKKKRKERKNLFRNSLCEVEEEQVVLIRELTL